MSRRKPRLTQAERHAQILALLRHEGTVRIATLAETFAVTTETARRDLDELAASGALKRTYGGGAFRSLIDEPALGDRSRTHAVERAAIARKAASLVESGDAVMIDGGSTTRAFAHALAARELHITVVTNCLPVARALGANPNCRTLICPGNYIAREEGTYGADAMDYLRRFQANKAFIGAGGITSQGVTDADSQGCAIKRAMAERADETVLLVDRSKYDQAQFERVCALSDLDMLVSEAAPPKRLAESLKRAGVRVVIAAP
jgi:DeoR/GlpR family transcriptional regulator of sugar metabolism